MKRLTACVGCCIVVCFQTASPANAIGGFLEVRDGRFVDHSGRHVILHGINIEEKSRARDYISWHGPEDYARMRQWGFNCIRFIITWDGVEPECGEYDESYLVKVDERIAWARQNGIYVMIDMHQDLWGRKQPIHGDGAPPWATFDEGKPHVPGKAVWSDAYFLSPMVQTAFDNFWANAPGPDGVGIQERFALAWRHVAARYADELAVAGYDLLNEPSPGTLLIAAALRAMPKTLEILGEDDSGDGLSLPELVERLKDPAARGELIEKVADVDAYRSFVDAAAPVFLMHERTQLQPMYQRVTDAIREVDSRHIVFLEPHIGTAGGMISRLEPVTAPDGKKDPQQALAPHAYDLTTDTRHIEQISIDRTEFILERSARNAREISMPALLGEWGAFHGTDKAVAAARASVRVLEKHLLSDTYWSFTKGIPDAPYFKSICRPYPMAVAGVIQSYGTNPETGEFNCVWLEPPEIDADTQIYLPTVWYPDGFEVTLEPSGTGYDTKSISPEDRSVYLLVEPAGEKTKRRLSVRPAEM